MFCCTSREINIESASYHEHVRESRGPTLRDNIRPFGITSFPFPANEECESVSMRALGITLAVLVVWLYFGGKEKEAFRGSICGDVFRRCGEGIEFLRSRELAGVGGLFSLYGVGCGAVILQKGDFCRILGIDRGFCITNTCLPQGECGMYFILFSRTCIEYDD